jgi:hypothetical protein
MSDQQRKASLRDTIDSFDYAIAAIEAVRFFAVYGASGPEFQKQLVEITKVLRAESGARPSFDENLAGARFLSALAGALETGFGTRPQ